MFKLYRIIYQTNNILQRHVLWTWKLKNWVEKLKFYFHSNQIHFCHMSIIAPSLLSADFKPADECAICWTTARQIGINLDVMDGASCQTPPPLGNEQTGTLQNFWCAIWWSRARKFAVEFKDAVEQTAWRFIMRAHAITLHREAYSTNKIFMEHESRAAINPTRLLSWKTLSWI